jgi:hypothetical protein
MGTTWKSVTHHDPQTMIATKVVKGGKLYGVIPERIPPSIGTNNLGVKASLGYFGYHRV